jgi:hypothetical protein
MSAVPNVRLNNGVEIPQFGLGVFQIPMVPIRTPSADRYPGAKASSTRSA